MVRGEGNYELHGCTVKFLTPDDILEKTDFIRPLYEDNWKEGGFDTTYKDENWNGCKWQRVGVELSGWIGKTYRDYRLFCGDGPDDISIMHEVVRVVAGVPQ